MTRDGGGWDGLAANQEELRWMLPCAQILQISPFFLFFFCYFLLDFNQLGKAD
jgi:hypothetical protein